MYLQYFWFRHCFLLQPQELGQLQELVLRLLSDPKAEVGDGPVKPYRLHPTP